MIDNATAIRSGWQTAPISLLDYEADPGTCWTPIFLEEGTAVDTVLNDVYRMPERHTRRSNIDLIMGDTSRADTIAYKHVAENPRRYLGQMVTEHWTALSSLEPALHMMSGVCIYAPKSSDTFTPDIPIAHFYQNTDALNRLHRATLSGLLGVYWTGRSDSPQEPEVVHDQTRRIAEMEEMIRRFSDLPEDWDSYGGSPISHYVAEEARRILVASINLNLPPAWAAPGGDGGIGIQWDTDQTELYIDIVPGEETTYLLTPKAINGIEADGVLTTANLSGVLNKVAESAA